MSYPYPANYVILVEEIITRIKAAGPAFTTPVAASDVFYGDQDSIAHTPTICVEPGDKQRTLEGAPNMTLNEYEIFILCYHNKVQEMQLTRKEVDQLAYEIEFLLHQDLQLTVAGSPLLIHGFVQRAEPGYVNKQNTLYKSVRLTYYGKNKTSLPVA